MRRKQYIDYLATVFGIFATTYGAYLLAWHYNHGNGLNALALVLLISGVISLTFAIALLTSRYIVSKKKINNNIPEVKNEEVEEKKIEKDPIEVKKTVIEKNEENPIREEDLVKARPQPKERPSSTFSRNYASTIYVKLVGHGPLLRIEGSRILDMRNNTYYRIENNMVKEEGQGPRFEIRGNQIRDAFGGYLYEISGNNINKIYGGFYASISGSYITLFDASKKYELTDSLSKSQLLAVAAILFDR